MTDSPTPSGFAVVRHPDIAVPGVLPAEALPVKRLHGWYRVSEYAPTPADLDINAYGADAPDLDAEPEPDEDTKPKTARKAAAKTTKESDE